MKRIRYNHPHQPYSLVTIAINNVLSIDLEVVKRFFHQPEYCLCIFLKGQPEPIMLRLPQPVAAAKLIADLHNPNLDLVDLTKIQRYALN